MSDAIEDEVELALPSPTAAKSFIVEHINMPARTIEVVKNETGTGYVGKATGLPS
jgi:hypothetical protein